MLFRCEFQVRASDLSQDMESLKVLVINFQKIFEIRIFYKNIFCKIFKYIFFQKKYFCCSLKMLWTGALSQKRFSVRANELLPLILNNSIPLCDDLL